MSVQYRKLYWTLFALLIKRRIHIVYIFLSQLLAQQLNSFTESLKMDNFPFSEEFNDIIYIRVIAEAKDIIVSDACLLFRSQIFC